MKFDAGTILSSRLTRSSSCLLADNTSSTMRRKIEIFVGNLRPDINPKDLVNLLKTYFAEAGVIVPHFRINLVASRRKRKSKRHAYVCLVSDEDRRALIKLDGTRDLSFVIRGKSLKVRDYGEKPSLKINFGVVSDMDCRLRQCCSSASAPALSTFQRNQLTDVRHPSVGTYRREYYWGQVLPTEDRTTEYKRGTGGYLKGSLFLHIRKYVCAFLNSEGGRLVIGVDDSGRVHGVKCSREEEDAARCQMDAVIKGFYPHVFTDRYVIDFITVRTSPNDNTDLDAVDSLLKVIEISVCLPKFEHPTLYENDKGEIYIRRDGGVEGPLKSAQIIDWCRERYTHRTTEAGASEKANVILDGIKSEWVEATWLNEMKYDDLRTSLKNIHDCMAEQSKILEKHTLVLERECLKKEDLVAVVERLHVQRGIFGFTCPTCSIL